MDVNGVISCGVCASFDGEISSLCTSFQAPEAWRQRATRSLLVRPSQSKEFGGSKVANLGLEIFREATNVNADGSTEDPRIKYHESCAMATCSRSQHRSQTSLSPEALICFNML